MSIFVLCKKMSILHTTWGLRGFDLIIFENLDISLEYMCDRIPIQQNGVHVWSPLQNRNHHRNLFLAFFLTIIVGLLSFYLFNWVKTCDMVRLRFPRIAIIALSSCNIYIITKHHENNGNITMPSKYSRLHFL